MQISKTPLSGGTPEISVVPEQSSIQAMIDYGVSESADCHVVLGEYFDRALYPIDPGPVEEVYRLFASNGVLVRENLSYAAPEGSTK